MIRPANISDIKPILHITKSCALHMIDNGIFQWNEHYPDKVSFINDVRNKSYVSVRLDTFSKNKRNLKFYESRGYHRLDEIYFPKQSKFPFYSYELIL